MTYRAQRWSKAHRDANESAIVAELRLVGASVERLNIAGAADLLVGYRGTNYLLECKRPGAKLNAEQVAYHCKWAGRIVIVYSPLDALAAIGIRDRSVSPRPASGIKRAESSPDRE